MENNNVCATKEERAAAQEIEKGKKTRARAHNRNTPAQVEGRAPTERSDRDAPTRLPAVIFSNGPVFPLYGKKELSRNFKFVRRV